MQRGVNGILIIRVSMPNKLQTALIREFDPIPEKLVMSAKVGLAGVVCDD